MTHTLPPGWEEKTLGELCDVLDFRRKPITQKDRTSGPYPYYGATGIVDFVDSFLFDEPLLLVGEDGARWGAGDPCAFIASGKYWVNNHAHVLKPKNFMSIQYLAYFLNYSDLTPYITGTTVPKLNQQKLRSISVSSPSLPEQKRIVEKLDKIFAAIDKAKSQTEKNFQNAKDIFSSYLNNIFNHPAHNGEEKTLGDILQLEYGKALKNSDRDSNGKYPVYGANGIKTYTNRYLYDKYTIIIGRKGSAGEINLTTEKFWPLDVTYYVIFDRQKYNLYFLYFLLSYLNLPTLAKGVKPGINRAEVYSLPVSIPPIAEQKRIVEKLDVLQSKTQELEKIYTQKLADLEELKQSVLQQAFSGKL